MEIFKTDKYRFRKKIAAFDYDLTIIKPLSKSPIPINKDDWTWLRPNVPEIIKNYYDKGYCIIIFTNQSKIWKVEQIKEVAGILNIPMMICIAIKKELYKPNPTLFTTNVTKEWDKDKSFFCGDALGRPGDWADIDLKFAINNGIKIKQPEEIFPFIKEKNNNKTKINFNSDKQEMIIMIGYPGSGKTTIAKQFGNNYQIINGDILHLLTFKTPIFLTKMI